MNQSELKQIIKEEYVNHLLTEHIKRVEETDDSWIIEYGKSEEEIEEAKLKSEGKIKKGSIVIAKKGIHKGEKHEVIHDFGNGKYNIKPTGFRNKYRLGAAGAKASELELVKEGNLNEISVEKGLDKVDYDNPVLDGIKITGVLAWDIQQWMKSQPDARKLNKGRFRDLVPILHKRGFAKQIHGANLKNWQAVVKKHIEESKLTEASVEKGLKSIPSVLAWDIEQFLKTQKDARKLTKGSFTDLVKALHSRDFADRLNGANLRNFQAVVKKHINEAAPRMKTSKETEDIKKVWMATSGLKKAGGSGRYGKEFDKAKKKAMQALNDMMTYSKIGG